VKQAGVTLYARRLSIMPFTSCVSFALNADKRHPCPLWLTVALEIGFGCVLLTDPFDVLFAHPIYSDGAKRTRLPPSASSLRTFRIGRVIYQYEKIEDYVRHVFPVFYFARCFILGKYDRSCVNNMPVNNELGVSVMLIWLPHYERMRQVIDRHSLIRLSITCK
jgi:hypothetical protein